MKFRIDLEGIDFDRLTSSSMEWGEHWSAQAARFEHAEKAHDRQPKWTWKYAYWLSDSWIAVILIRTWLKEAEADYEVLWDTADPPSYVILTDYASPTWRKEGD